MAIIKYKLNIFNKKGLFLFPFIKEAHFLNILLAFLSIVIKNGRISTAFFSKRLFCKVSKELDFISLKLF